MTSSISLMPLVVGSVTAAATILAVIVTSLFNLKVARLNIDFQNRLRTKEFKPQKLEELFFLFYKWDTCFSSIYLQYLACYKGKITYRNVLDLTSKTDMLAPGDAQKYRMILEIYFPELNSLYPKVDSARAAVARFFSNPASNGLNVSDFVASQKYFDAACHDFRGKISSYARDVMVS